MNDKFNRLLSVLFLTLIFCLSIYPMTSSVVVFASDDANAEYVNHDNLEDGEAHRSKFANDGEKLYYRLEAKMADDEKSPWYNIIGKASDTVSFGINETVMIINRVIFFINTKMSGLMIGLVESISNFSFIDKVIDNISKKVKNIVGVSGNLYPKFNSSGMFLPLIKIITLVVIFYSFYQLIWKRSFITSINELFKYVVVLTVALLLFTNFGSFLTGMNNISNAIGQLVSGSPSQTQKFGNTLWEHFVDKPYLTLQYGTSNVKDLAIDGMSGEERVKELLSSRVGSSEREELIDKEVNDRDNYYMKYASTDSKTFLNIAFLFFNALTSIPVFLMALAMLFTQIWFVIIAMFAPFALLIASIPIQFSVLKRYFFELSLPLIVKVGLHFIFVMLMFLTDIATGAIGEMTSDFFSDHMGTAFLNALVYLMLFIGVFLLRKRIMNIIASGSQMASEIRDNLGGFIKKPVQTGATVAGAGVGAMVAGSQGAMVGANIGATAGNVVAGDQDIASATHDLTRTAYQNKMLNNMNKKRSDSNKPRLTPEQDREKNIKTAKSARLIEEGYTTIDEIMNEEQVDDKTKDKFYRELSKQEVDMENIDKELFEKQFEKGHTFDEPKKLAKAIKENQLADLEKEVKMKQEKEEMFDVFLDNRNLYSHEKQEVYSFLEDKAISVSDIPEEVYKNVDNKIKAKLEEDNPVDYVEEFKKELNKWNEKQILEEQKERILDNTDDGK